MGVDTVIRIRVDGLSDEELNHLSTQGCARLKDIAQLYEDSSGLFHRDPGFPEKGDWVEVNTLLRYYGPGYERGHWPDIRATLAWCRENVGPTYYSSDVSDELGQEVTEEFLRRMDEYWAGPMGDAYHEDIRRRYG